MGLLIAFLAGAALAALLAVAFARGRGGDGQRLDGLFDGLLSQLRGELERFDGRQREASRELGGRLSVIGQHQAAMLEQTGRLAEALRRPGLRGQWGEATLRNVVEAAGLSELVDFEVQPWLVAGDDDEQAGLRPDLLVRLPGGGCLAVDAKVPLDGYLDACSTGDAGEQAACLDRHVRQVRARVRELATRRYWAASATRGRSPEMTVMFVPSEAAFAAAAAHDPRLLHDAGREHVVIATPATMLALLQVVALGWREARMSEHAERVRQVALELVARVGAVSGHLAKQGRALEAAVSAHNAAVGSFESRLLASARRIGELGVGGGDELAQELPGVGASVRLPRAVG